MTQAFTQSKTTCKKLVFKQAPSDIKGQTNFSDKCWGNATSDSEYICSANKLLKELKESIFKEARWLGKSMTHDKEQSVTTSTTHTKEASMGCCVALIDVA